MPASQNHSNYAFRFGLRRLATKPTAKSGLKKIKSINGRVPAVLVTGWDIKQEGSEKEDSYLDLIIHKPFEMDQVLNIVHEGNVGFHDFAPQHNNDYACVTKSLQLRVSLRFTAPRYEAYCKIWV